MPTWQRFYMNYVGCKVDVVMQSIIPHIELFYMNYVGCKALFLFHGTIMAQQVLYELCGM